MESKFVEAIFVAEVIDRRMASVSPSGVIQGITHRETRILTHLILCKAQCATSNFSDRQKKSALSTQLIHNGPFYLRLAKSVLHRMTDQFEVPLILSGLVKNDPPANQIYANLSRKISY